MGFFDKIKNAKNALTGGGAQVSLQIGTVQRGQPAPVQVNALSKANFGVSAVYVVLKCVEKADYIETEFEDGEIERERERNQQVVFKTRIDIAGGGELTEGQQASWQGQLSIPAETNPTLHGKTIHNVWYIQAGLDARGNDPDSGWVELHVV